MTNQTAFDLEQGELLKESGIDQAIRKADRRILLDNAHFLAQSIAKYNGSVTADDVFREMKNRNMSPELLGNAWGSIFRGCFEQVGWVKSERVSNHARMIRVWRLREES